MRKCSVLLLAKHKRSGTFHRALIKFMSSDNYLKMHIPEILNIENKMFLFIS